LRTGRLSGKSDSSGSYNAFKKLTFAGESTRLACKVLFRRLTFYSSPFLALLCDRKPISSRMDGEIDYKKYDESELVDMFSRTDPRWAPVNYARLKELLIERDCVVRDGGLGPGSAVPSAEKLQSLIGSTRPIECKVTFGQTTGLFRWFEPSHNDFDFADSGTLVADGIHLRLSG
jgi:hypothetical protein